MRCCKVILLVLTLYTLHHEGVRSQGKASVGQIVHKVENVGEQLLSKLTYEQPRYVVAVYPAAGYSRRTGVEMGLMPLLGWYSKRDDEKLNTLSFSVQISTKSMVEFRSEGDLFFANNWRLTTNLEYFKLPERFWGVYSSADNYEAWHYNAQRWKGSAEVFKLIGNHWYAGVNALAGRWLHTDWEFQPNETLTGVYGGSSLGVGPVLMLDSRDNHIWPYKGVYFKSTYKHYFGEWTKGDGFSNFQNDFRAFLPVAKSVLAFQALVDLSNGDVPFYLLGEVGGKYRLRGLDHSKRVVDKSVWMVRSEFRSHLWWRVGSVLFIESGGAGRRFLSDSSDPIWSVGGGLRLRVFPNELLNIRLDGAVSTGGFYGITLSLKEAF